jgi:hypothetical protein
MLTSGPTDSSTAGPPAYERADVERPRNAMERLRYVSQLLLELEAKPGKNRTGRLIVTDEGVDVSGTTFRWTEVNRLRYRALDQYVNGAYMHTTFTIGIGDAKRTAQFMLVSGTTGALKTKIDRTTRSVFHERWGHAVDLIDQHGGTRIIAAAVTRVRQAGEVEMAGARIDSRGVHKRGLFGTKTIPWSDYAGSEREKAYLYLFARNGEKRKTRIHLMNNDWNAVLLPRVLQILHDAR